jgi:hypothetical protein
MKRNFRVSITATTTHEYVIPECNSPEEAEDIAENLFADGDEGEVAATDIEMIEALVDEGGE